MDDSPVKVSFEPGIINIDPWEFNIPYSKCFKHNMDASMSAIGYGLRYFKQKEKEFEKMNRKEMSEEIINGLTTGAYVLTSCSRTDEGFGRSEIIAHFAMKPGIFGAPKLKSKALAIRKVVFNDPATIVFWADGDKTVVKCGENDIFDPEKGLALAISKKFLGNKGKYYDIFKKWLPEEYKASDTYYADNKPEVTIDDLSDEQKKVILDTFKSTCSNVAERFNNAVYGAIDASDESTSNGTN